MDGTERAVFVLACELLLARGTKPTVPEVEPLVISLYRYNPSGGSLHIVLDDDNVADDNVLWCKQRAEEQGDRPAALLAGVLLLMSRTQRLKLARGPHTIEEQEAGGW